MEHELALISWGNMLAACYDPVNAMYPLNFRKGIIVCERWRTSFDNFLEDMGDREPGERLHRKDRDGLYNKENCEWIDTRESMALSGKLKMRDDLIKKLLHLVHDEKKSFQEIAHLFPVKIARLKQLAAGVDYRLPGYVYPTEKEDAMPRVKLKDSERKEIIERFEDGESASSLAKEFSVTARYVRMLKPETAEDTNKRMITEFAAKGVDIPMTLTARRAWLKKIIEDFVTLKPAQKTYVEETRKAYEKMSDKEFMENIPKRAALWAVLLVTEKKGYNTWLET